MNIKNLKIYNDLLKFSKTRLVALSLVGTTLFAVGGCKSNTKPADIKKDVSIVEVIDCLSKVDKLTTIDEDMKKPIERSNGKICSIEDLQNEFNEAINIYDIDMANAALYDIGITALKSLLSSTYNISFTEIKNLYITMIAGNKIDENGYKEYDDNYYCPIIFDYKNISYAILPEGKLAREIAYYLYMTYCHKLAFVDALNGDISDAYDIFLVALLLDGKNKNEVSYIDKGINSIVCDGSIEFNYNYDKLDVYHDYITDNNYKGTEINIENESNKNQGLPVKALTRK